MTKTFYSISIIKYVCISGLHEHFQYITDNNFKINHKMGFKITALFSTV